MSTAVYAPNWLGDAVMSLPFISQCAELHGEKVSIVCKSWVAPVFENHPDVKEIIQFEARDLSGIRKILSAGDQLNQYQFDYFYLLSDSLRCAVMAKRSAAAEITGFNSPGRSFFLTSVADLPTDPGHRSAKYLTLLQLENSGQKRPIGKFQGITLTNEEIDSGRNALEPIGDNEPVAFFPFSVAGSRCLPESLALEIIERIDRRVVIFGGKSDARTIGKLIDKSQPDVISFCGTQSLRESMTLISACVGAVAADSGLGHISASLGIPTVSLFGAGDPNHTRPLGSKTKVINKDVFCSPCRKNYCSNVIAPLFCLNSITAQEVSSALNNLVTD